MGVYHTDQGVALRTLLRDADLEPHPGEEASAYVARLVREHDRQRRSHRHWAAARVGLTLTLAAFGVTVF